MLGLNESISAWSPWMSDSTKAIHRWGNFDTLGNLQSGLFSAPIACMTRHGWVPSSVVKTINIFFSLIHLCFAGQSLVWPKIRLVDRGLKDDTNWEGLSRSQWITDCQLCRYDLTRHLGPYSTVSLKGKSGITKPQGKEGHTRILNGRHRLPLHLPYIYNNSNVWILQTKEAYVW